MKYNLHGKKCSLLIIVCLCAFVQVAYLLPGIASAGAAIQSKA